MKKDGDFWDSSTDLSHYLCHAMQPIITFKVTSITHETADAVTVRLTPLNGEIVSYRPGQFLAIDFHINNREIRRSFSLSSVSGMDEDLAITVKRIPNGEISNYVYRHLKLGDEIQALPPAGRFVLDTAEVKRDVFMVAAGSGITPIFSIIKDVLVNDPLSRIILIYSNRDEKSTIFYNQLNELTDRYPERFKCIYIFSDPIDKNYVYKGHLSLELLNVLIENNLQSDRSKAEFMLCGPFDYMRKSEMIIVVMGFEKAQIHKENFVVIAEQEAINTPPVQEAGDKTVTINIRGQVFELVVPVGKPILKAALENNIYLPYSCQGGICGTCSAICKSGEVKMSINDVLTQKELDKGWILTCVGYPMTEQVELEYE